MLKLMIGDKDLETVVSEVVAQLAEIKEQLNSLSNKVEQTITIHIAEGESIVSKEFTDLKNKVEYLDKTIDDHEERVGTLESDINGKFDESQVEDLFDNMVNDLRISR